MSLSDPHPANALPHISGQGGRGLARCLAAVVLLTALAWVSRWVFLATRLEAWDPIQHALGLADFDVFRHTPHPPGAPTYHALLRAVHLIEPDPATVVLAVGVVLSVLAVLATYALGATLCAGGNRRGAAAAAVFVLACPALWLDGISGGSGGGDVVLAALVGLFAFRAAEHQRWIDTIAGAVALGLLLGFRQNVNLASACMFPLWAWGLLHVPWRKRFAGLGALAAVCVAWSVPTAWACGGWQMWIEQTLNHTRSAHGGGVFAGGVLNGRLPKVLTAAQLQAAIHLGLLWIPLVFVVISRLLRRDWRRVPRVRQLTIFWLLPLAGGGMLLPYHINEYFVMAMPILCWWSSEGLERITRCVAEAMHRLGCWRPLPVALLARGLAIASCAAVVVGNAGYFLLVRSSDPQANGYYATLGRVEKAFDPATTMVVSRGLGQRIAALSFPEHVSVYLPVLARRAAEPYAGRIYSNGQEQTFDSPTGTIPAPDRRVQTLVVTDPFVVACEDGLKLKDLDGFTRYVHTDRGELVVRYGDHTLTVALMQEPVGEDDRLAQRPESTNGGPR